MYIKYLYAKLKQKLGFKYQTFFINPNKDILVWLLYFEERNMKPVFYVNEPTVKAFRVALKEELVNEEGNER